MFLIVKRRSLYAMETRMKVQQVFSTRRCAEALTIVPRRLVCFTGRYVELRAAGTPFLRANHSGVSGAFAPSGSHPREGCSRSTVLNDEIQSFY
jgi:hypothetical protein